MCMYTWLILMHRDERETSGHPAVTGSQLCQAAAAGSSGQQRVMKSHDEESEEASFITIENVN